MKYKPISIVMIDDSGGSIPVKSILHLLSIVKESKKEKVFFNIMPYGKPGVKISENENSEGENIEFIDSKEETKSNISDIKKVIVDETNFISTLDENTQVSMNMIMEVCPQADPHEVFEKLKNSDYDGDKVIDYYLGGDIQ